MNTTSDICFIYEQISEIHRLFWFVLLVFVTIGYAVYKLESDNNLLTRDVKQQEKNFQDQLDVLRAELEETRQLLKKTHRAPLYNMMNTKGEHSMFGVDTSDLIEHIKQTAERRDNMLKILGYLDQLGFE